MYPVHVSLHRRVALDADVARAYRLVDALGTIDRAQAHILYGQHPHTVLDHLALIDALNLLLRARMDVLTEVVGPALNQVH